MMQGEEGPGPARSSNVVAAPPWLQPLLDTEFFGMCHVHTESFVSGQQQQQQSNHFCLDCPFAGPLCPVCVASAHAQHHVVQVLILDIIIPFLIDAIQFASSLDFLLL